MLLSVTDDDFMKVALEEARMALEHGDVPIGAVAVRDGEVIARAHNKREIKGDPTAHAELLALRQASRRLGRWRLHDVTLYVTIEPCAMCAGAMVWARLERLVYGSPDPKAGAVYSLYNIVQDPRLNHQCEVTSGILEEECSDLLQTFFRGRRGRFDFR